MGKDLFRLILVGGAIVFAILFGMELASSGIGDVYGPMETPAGAGTHPEAGTRPDAATAEAPSAEEGRFGSEPPGISVGETEDDPIPRLDHTPVIDRLAGKTAEILQNASKGGIHFIVNLFSKTTE
ncbi:hypothetical protein J19TS2_43830 [Cohnella xylanilytica]|uniref:Uncharacterized protein n=1 Tax=Cohnella xylanilytica TaxID=557555 RepID=A0A841TZQ4_9BACL|nr:hypothetical protein [Cohnella xylanilytica]MBB6692592.1 hypothetical protein [Cohnella xylanilytica]GIO14828.1 hypothetical protein J19TS2_43830 [Cohnella xylanilytica]